MIKNIDVFVKILICTLNKIGYSKKIIKLKVHEKISSQFQVLRRPSDKAWKRRNIRHIPSFHNAVRRDVSAPEM